MISSKPGLAQRLKAAEDQRPKAFTVDSETRVSSGGSSTDEKGVNPLEMSAYRRVRTGSEFAAPEEPMESSHEYGF
ncbi:unnamed protein product [Pleuronectes platessa]|uniref:Uncharacterized protein n=1 Tax=Pleuronectes platessa TaxID=8262 RepID=A0A9N7V997_PLEPL|nr:unnamed protein product [Pleuronectes platessa]